MQFLLPNKMIADISDDKLCDKYDARKNNSRCCLYSLVILIQNLHDIMIVNSGH